MSGQMARTGSDPDHYDDTLVNAVKRFQIKRGIATGDNEYFILGEQEVQARGLPKSVLRPILPSPRYLQQDEVTALDRVVDGSRRAKVLHGQGAPPDGEFEARRV